MLTTGARIKALRKASRMTQNELAAYLGITRENISLYENDKIKNIPADIIAKIAQRFDTTPTYLRGELPMNDWADTTLEKKTLSKSEPTVAEKATRALERDIKKNHKIPPYMPLLTAKTSFFPIIGTIKAGPDGIAYEDYQGSAAATNSNLDQDKTNFFLKVSGDSMIGDGIHSGDLALIERTDVIEDDGAIYAVIYDGENGTLKHVTQTKDAIVLSPSNPQYKPIVIPAEDSDQFWVVGKLKQVTKMF